MVTRKPKTTPLILSGSNKSTGFKLPLIGYYKVKNDVLDPVKGQ